MTKGRRIRLKREELNISQTDFAKRVNISKQTLYKYENDIVTNIPSDKIEEIADALGVSPGYILGWVSDDEEPSQVNDLAQEFYSLYKGASPEVQKAVDILLASSKPRK